MIFRHSRFQVWDKSQHPLSHDLSEFFYTNPALPTGNVYNAKQAMDWVFANLYPQTKPAVANPAALPLVGNTINDYRIVQDDGDGKAASYRWEQREGELAPSWHKIYDMDWGEQSILSAFLLKTSDVYVYRHGYDDVDATGAPIVGLLAGQAVYGGESANTHLTLFANAGDGVGPNTGNIQFGDNTRPLTNETFSSGESLYRWLKVWTKEANIGTLDLVGGSITDTSGAISFGNENLSTTGTSAALSFTAGSALTVASGLITDTSGAISFGDEDLSTTGTITANDIQAVGAPSAFASGTAVGTLTLADGSITDSTGAIDFGDEDLDTLGTLTVGDGGFFNNILIGGIGTENKIQAIDLNGSLFLSANGTGYVDVMSNMLAKEATFDGDVDLTAGKTLTLTGPLAAVYTPQVYTEKVTSSAIPLILTGVPEVQVDGDLVPAGIYDLGSSGFAWDNFFVTGNIRDAGVNIFAVSDLMTLRDINVGVAAGMTIFWTGAKWEASYPDSEVDHGTITGLLDDDHTQYPLSLGRAGGQAIAGGVAASENLSLDSTSHATKGFILFNSTLRPGTDDLFDIGDPSYRVNNLYMNGEFIGGRLENTLVGSPPAASALTKGRMFFATDTNDVYCDTGGTWVKINIEKHVFADAVGWDGVATSVVYTVSANVTDARYCQWQLLDNASSYEAIDAKITKTATQVTVSVDTPLPAGTYTLVGIG